MGPFNRRITAAFAVVVVVVAITFGAPCEAQPSIIPTNVALFVFGDSVYDVGNTGLTSVADCNFLPYGETFFKKPSGRFCDGRVIPDFIAEYAGMSFIPPYFQPNLTDYTNGVSFAYAGAPILVIEDTSAEMADLTRQVVYFLKVVEKLREQIGVRETRILLGNAVYLFSIGGIDYTDLAMEYVDSSLTPSVIVDFTDMVIGNLTSHIKTIYNEGGRKFAFQNIGPIGCLPSIRRYYTLKGKLSGICASTPQYLAIEHNIRFLDTARNLVTQLPGFKYSIYDYYTQANNRVIYDNIFGFRVTTEACCGSGLYGGEFSCGNTTDEFTLCSNPNQYLWFDPAHPTENANRQFSRMFWSGGPDVVWPVPLKDLFAISDSHVISPLR